MPTRRKLRVRLVAGGVCHTDAIVCNECYPTPLSAVLGDEDVVRTAASRPAGGAYLFEQINTTFGDSVNASTFEPVVAFP
ncbi:hypothetical protein D1O33_18050 [Rhodococcus rhodochrous]|nr:hypothetical protein D1O33_18050 [Rhodococcus rhodochrous]QOH56677.1 hypothetical protein C6Y44_12445 [Rhodococcus rhodochrous]